jgi:BASS family bile acid:Na+ symporter
MAVLRRFNALFVLWVLLASALAYLVPMTLRWFAPFITPGLGVIMLGMGLTLLPADLTRVLRRWPAVLVGIAAQFAFMPLAGFAVTRTLRLPAEVALGVILVCCCPGGTASNVIAYLAGGDVALSISMTAASTLLSPVLTPALLSLFAGRAIEVSFADQAAVIAQVVVVPVLVGLAVRHLLERSGRAATAAMAMEVFPSLSMLFIVLIVGCIVALNAERLATFGGGVVAAVALTNAAGYASGYGAGRLLGFDVRTARTVAIEVGMQNSGLGVALANAFFAAPAVALPSAFFSFWHNLTGPALASYWSARGAARS